MTASLTIGEFSRMTHLSVKTLRHYHRVGLLDPADVDATTGYRYYSTDQVATAQVIRRFRQLDMPVDEIRAMLAAPDAAVRNRLIATHLDRLETQLAQTQAAVASLRALLEHPDAPLDVEVRSVPAVRAMAIAETIDRDEVAAWWTGAFAEIYGLLLAHHVEPVGPGGGLYATELFADERGLATVFVPIPDLELGLDLDLDLDLDRDLDRRPGRGRVHQLMVPAAELAIAVHDGTDEDIDLTYGALGRYVADRAMGVEGPVREHYVVTGRETDDPSQWRTEIGWPVAGRHAGQ